MDFEDIVKCLVAISENETKPKIVCKPNNKLDHVMKSKQFRKVETLCKPGSAIDHSVTFFTKNEKKKV